MWIATSKSELKYLDLEKVTHLDYSPNGRPLGGLKINGEMFCHDINIGEYLFNTLRDYFMSVGGLKQTNLYDAIEKNNKRVLKENKK